jgi:hypothetical protein
VLYIVTTSPFPFKRLSQLISSFGQEEEGGCSEQGLAEHLFVEHIQDAASLWNMITCRLPVLIAKQSLTTHPMRLLIIDSIGAMFRGEETIKSKERTQYLVRLSTELHALNVNANLAIVIVNQVTDKIQSIREITNPGESETSSQNIGPIRYPHEQLDPYGYLSCVPCLGLLWANLITTRLSIYRDPRTKFRMVYVVFSPFIGNKLSEFTIDDKGIHLTPTHPGSS